MSGAYTADGRRRSSITHSRRGHACDLCGTVVFGNGGQVSHGRGHVRRGEAVELFKDYGNATTTRIFFAPDDSRIEKFKANGFMAVLNGTAK